MAEKKPDNACELTHELLSRGVCVSPRGEVLLCRLLRSPQRSFLPGGHIDPGEGARAALVREIREELALPAFAGEFLGAAEHFFGPEGNETFEMNVVFALEIPDIGDSPRSAEPWQEFFWAPPDRLADFGFEPACLRKTLPGWIERTAKNRSTTTLASGCPQTPFFESAYDATPPAAISTGGKSEHDPA